MKWLGVIFLLSLVCYAQDVSTLVATRPELRIAQFRPVGGMYRDTYPEALSSLLRHIAKETTANVATVPLQISSFTDERLAQCPFVYINLDARKWEFSPEEGTALKRYLENGGFLLIDAGITASFLRGTRFAQHHSFAEWDAAPEIKTAFAQLFPETSFIPLRRTDPIFRTFYQGLPDASLLPDTVRDYVVQEKWPDGTYSAVALRLNGRIAVLCTPIIAMGWGRNSLGQWLGNIQFRVLESAKGIDESLQNAAYSGERFEVVREDGAKDVLYCQERALPAWCHEANGHWRVFRYYSSSEINDFAHTFYTRLGTNILLYALLQ
ncbi:MAG: DUF4159 domain-containing protein [Victivallales bacterium]|nr:DUF4159 domain-containing protein [Victivallales bacterium]